MMGKARKHSSRKSSGYTQSIETDSDMEEAHVRKRSRLSLNGEDRYGVPKKIPSLSKMSSFERESLVRKLRLELEQVRSLRKRIACISSDTVLLSPPYSDLHSCSDGSRRPPVGNGRKGSKKGPPSSTVASLMKECQTLLDRLWSHKLGLPFRIPVDPVLLNIPDYFTVVKHPMDLGTIRSRLRGGEYTSPLEFAADVRLTFSNSMAYNPPGNQYHKMARDLSAYFESRWKIIERKIPVVVEPPVMSLTSSASLESEVPCSVPLPRKETAAVEPAAKLVMTDGEKKKLSQDLEALGEDFPQNIADLFREQSGSVDQSGEVEIEIDIDTLSDDTLVIVRKLLDEFLREKKKSQEKSQPCEMEIVHDSGFSSSLLQPSKCDLLIDEDVDIVGGNDPHVSSHPPLKIEKDVACRNSSSSSSSESSSSSSDSDSCSSSESETTSIKASNPTNKEDKKEGRLGIKKKDSDINGERIVVNDSLNELGKHDVGETPTAMDAVHALPEEETAPPDRQDSPGKRQRAALLKNRFADTIMKAREKTLTQGENGDPEKLRIEREKFEKRLREENARLQAEAKAAEEARRKTEAEAAEKARREREQEREAARQALQKIEKTVEINESRRFMEDLEMLRVSGVEGDQLSTFMEEMSPKCSQDMLGSFKMEGISNPLEQLGLYMKMDEEDEEDEPHFSQGDVDEQPLDRKERLTLSPQGVEREDQLDSGNDKPVSEEAQDNGNQEDEKPINRKEGEEQIENVPVNTHGEEGGDQLVYGSEEVVSEKAQDNVNHEAEKLINQNEGKEELEIVLEQENGIEDKGDEEAEVVEKGDEEAEVMDEETQVVDVGKEEAEVADMGVKETEELDVDMVKIETELVDKREKETEVVDNGEKEAEVVVNMGGKETEEVDVDMVKIETELVDKREKGTEVVENGEKEAEVVVNMGVKETEEVDVDMVKIETEVVDKREKETEVVDNGEKETEVVGNMGEQENEFGDMMRQETEVVHKRVEETEVVEKGEQETEVVHKGEPEVVDEEIY